MTAQFFRNAPRPDVPSGEAIIAELRAHAAKRGISLIELVRPLAGARVHPGSWIHQMTHTKCPKPITLERVEALLRGDPIPPVQPRKFGDGPRRGHVRRGRIDKQIERDAEAAVQRRRTAAMISTVVHTLERPRTPEERSSSASELIRWATEEWPEIINEVRAFAAEDGRSLAEAWRSVITAGLQCLREGDEP